MSLAAIAYQRGFHINDFMAALARQLAADGVRLCGLVQENSGDEDCGPMALIDLASTDRFGISQDLGSCSQGCRLDPHGLAEAGTRLEQAIVPDIELLLLNKFGKAEAEEGAGLRTVVARAIELGIPVLTTVRAPYDAAWANFHGGYAETLPPDAASVLAWCTKAVAARRAETAKPAAGVAP